MFQSIFPSNGLNTFWFQNNASQVTSNKRFTHPGNTDTLLSHARMTFSTRTELYTKCLKIWNIYTIWHRSSLSFITRVSGFMQNLARYAMVERLHARVRVCTCSYMERLTERLMHAARCSRAREEEILMCSETVNSAIGYFGISLSENRKPNNSEINLTYFNVRQKNWRKMYAADTEETQETIKKLDKAHWYRTNLNPEA